MTCHQNAPSWSLQLQPSPRRGPNSDQKPPRLLRTLGRRLESSIMTKKRRRRRVTMTVGWVALRTCAGHLNSALGMPAPGVSSGLKVKASMPNRENLHAPRPIHPSISLCHSRRIARWKAHYDSLHSPSPTEPHTDGSSTHTLSSFTSMLESRRNKLLLANPKGKKKYDGSFHSFYLPLPSI